MWSTIEARGQSYTVLPPQVAHAANFWADFAAGRWEPAGLARLDALLTPAVHAAHIKPECPPPLFFDVGAWVGPYALSAGRLGARVVAVEPDPAARSILEQNIYANAAQDIGGIEVVGAAVVGNPGERYVYLQMDDPGDSMSSIVRTNLPHVIEVPALTIDDLIANYGEPDLVKLDVEGGECLIMPAAGPELRRLQVPVLLSLHSQWFLPETVGALMWELEHWYLERIEDETYLCTPRNA